MKNKLPLLFILCFARTTTAQVSFAKEVAPVIFSNCSYCHNKSGNAPFSLENYAEIENNLSSIKYVLDNHIMPPWKLDSGDVKFKNERRISESDKNLIYAWISEGHQCDNAKVAYKKGVAKNIFGESLGKPDIILKPNESYKQVANSKDKFVSYLMGTGVHKDVSIRAVVIKPGNTRILHHARLEYDTSKTFHTYSALNKYFETGVIEDSVATDQPRIGFYVPGLNYTVFPKGSGITIGANGEFLLNLHYSPVSKTEEDQTEIWLYLNKTAHNREAIFKGWSYNDATTKVPKDSITTISAISPPIAQKFTLTAVEPHMHLLGQSIKVQIVHASSGDTTLMFNLPNWDFNWQEFYFLERPLIFEVGDRLLITARFDNSRHNAKNPFYPPRDVDFGGMATTNEMLNVVMLGLIYQPGDENLELY